jgi:signal transduction histidine kinase/ActR/RegA family two-component response regulator
MGRLFLLFLLTMIANLALSQNAYKGVIDLRSIDFETQSVNLDGEWEFYWNQLLEPDEIQNPGKLVSFPSLWNDLEGVKISNFGYATYRLKIVLPPNDAAYTLHVEDMFSSFNLFVNGVLVYKNGTVAKTREEYQPEWKPDFIPLRNLNDTSTIVLQIANFDHRNGGIKQSLVLGKSDYMKDQELEILSYDLILTGSLCMGGLFLLGLYLFGHHDKAILYFSMFCIVYSYRIIGTHYYILHHLINASWYVLSRLEYISLFMSVFLFSKFVFRLYPNELKTIYFRILHTICLSFSLVALAFPAWVFSYLTSPFIVVLIIYLILTMRVYIGAYLNKRLGSKYALMSTGVVIVIFLYSISVYFGVLPEWNGAIFWVSILFFISQSLMLSFRFAFSLKLERDRAEIASKAKSEFLSTMSHEIRTPMNAVIGLTNILLEEGPKTSQLETLNTLKFSAKNLLVIINDILDFSKIEANKIQFESVKVDIEELLMSLKRIFQPIVRDKNLEFIFNIDPNAPSHILCDPTRTSQVLTNLINNAVKFTNEGSITVNLKVIKKEVEKVTLKFEVVDTGIGIEQHKLSEIFESFTQASSSSNRQFGGTGLGLTITRQLLRLQGSDLYVESKVGKGSVFYFHQIFEVVTASETITNVPEPIRINLSEARIDDAITIMVVEDNLVNILVANKFLNRWGFKTVIAKNGQEAIDKYQSEVNIQLILMDLQMPVMDGYEATKQLRKMGVTIPIIALTASALMEEEVKARNAGMDDIVTKPFDPDQILKKITESLAKNPS